MWQWSSTLARSARERSPIHRRKNVKRVRCKKWQVIDFGQSHWLRGKNTREMLLRWKKWWLLFWQRHRCDFLATVRGPELANRSGMVWFGVIDRRWDRWFAHGRHATKWGNFYSLYLLQVPFHSVQKEIIKQWKKNCWPSFWWINQITPSGTEATVLLNVYPVFVS